MKRVYIFISCCNADGNGGILKGYTVMLRIILSLIILLTVVNKSEASEISKVKTWDSLTHLRLSQCFIAEATDSEADWSAIAHALHNWQQVRKRVHPHMRYVDVVTSVCSIHKLSNSKRSRRQKWIRGLSYPRVVGNSLVFKKPAALPKHMDWESVKTIWIKALLHASKWNKGLIEDPCDGEAIVWGAPSNKRNRLYLKQDDPAYTGHKIVRLSCSNSLLNDFYRAMNKAERRRHAKASK